MPPLVEAPSTFFGKLKAWVSPDAQEELTKTIARETKESTASRKGKTGQKIEDFLAGPWPDPDCPKAVDMKQVRLSVFMFAVYPDTKHLMSIMLILPMPNCPVCMPCVLICL